MGQFIGLQLSSPVAQRQKARSQEDIFRSRQYHFLQTPFIPKIMENIVCEQEDKYAIQILQSLDDSSVKSDSR